MIKKPLLTRKSLVPFRKDYNLLTEAFVAALYYRLLGPGDAAVDAGANAGMHTLPLARLVGPRGKVIAFEPNPAAADVLAARLQKENLQNVTVHRKALSDAPGRAAFVVYPENNSLSHLRHDGPLHALATRLYSEVLEVECVRMEDVVGDDVAFIKCDLEGADLLGLRGARAILEKSRPVAVFECGRETAARQFGFSPDDLLGYFRERRYLLFDIHGLPLTAESWNSDEMGWEYVAVPQEFKYLGNLMVFIQKFWATVSDLPYVGVFAECALIGKTLPLSLI